MTKAVKSYILEYEIIYQTNYKCTMKMYYILVIILCIEGCTLPFLNKENDIIVEGEDAKYVKMVEVDIKDITDFMDKHKKEDVEFDLVLFTSKDESYGTFGVLTLETHTEIDMFFMYSLEYVISIMSIMSNEITGNDYDWSWNLVVLDMERQINYFFDENKLGSTEKN